MCRPTAIPVCDRGSMAALADRLAAMTLALRCARLAPPTPPSPSSSPRCGRRRRPPACRARRSTPRRSGLEPDYKLPDLILPGRPATGAPSQAEFVQVPADYVKEASHRAARGGGAEADAEASRRARTRSKSVSAFPPASCWRSGAARPITAATGCLTTRCAWWRRRPMSAGARISIAASSSSR